MNELDKKKAAPVDAAFQVWCECILLGYFFEPLDNAEDKRS